MTHDLVLHIGGNKTGSTAIQHFLVHNLEALRQTGFLIPGHELDWTSLVTGAHVARLQTLLTGADARNQITTVFERLFAARSERIPILISAENLSNLGNSDFFADLCAQYKTKIVIYIRRQDDLLASSWQQWYSKQEKDFNAWIIRALQTIGHWEAVIAGWERVAGPDSVIVRIYDRDEFPEGNIALDFLDAIGARSTDTTFHHSRALQNPSYSEFITPLVSGNRSIFENVHDNLFYDLIGELTNNHYTGGKRYSVFSKEQRNNVIGYFEHQNQRLCAKYFPGRSRLFKPVDHRIYAYAEPGELQQEQLRFLTHMVFELAKRLRIAEQRQTQETAPASSPEGGHDPDGKPGLGRLWWGK